MRSMENSASSWHEKAMAVKLDERSMFLRYKIAWVLDCSRRGHLGSSLSLVEIMRTLYDKILRFDPEYTTWENRDRCILSKGHGCITQYVMLADKKFIPEQALEHFCRHDGLLGGHPDATKIPGVECSTGSLGHGLPIGLGMALAARMDKRDSWVFVVAGDGEMNEGSMWEACLSAGKHCLDKLVLIIDYNKYQSYGSVRSVQNLEPLSDKLKSFNWEVSEINGHDITELEKTFTSLPLKENKPSAIICHTVKGKGVPFAENNLDWHHKSKITEAQMQAIYQTLPGIGGHHA